ncbi:MAG: ATP-binding cassette domain-containing protein [Alphaproteobacteria bacterium]|nr:ATP-binding cassette domain-containing protein [Alphaproteobacteria bacterium]MCB9696613.1 ATP-binding cassette domain-containing protein [Alphaproteobacteria bacterium]
MTPESAAIRIVDLHKRFGDLVVLDGVSMDIPKGRTTTILGPSGTGKSVLLKHIVGLLRPDSGQVWVGDVDMAVASERQKLQVRKRFGMMFQGGALFEDLTAGENVSFPLRYHTRMTEAQRRERANEKLALVELPDVYDRPTSALSGGMRKRVALARAIVLEPEVVLFDEPNSGLDPLTSTTIDELIVRMKERLGITFVIITHDIVQAVAVSDQIGMLWKGHLVAYAETPAFVDSEVEIVRQFMARNLHR